ncbi:CHASE2 domain-containing protein [Candidatus Neomarinimicrobiota bacterium]
MAAVWTAVSIVVTMSLHSLGIFDLANYKVLDFAYSQIRGPLSGVSARQPIPRDSLGVVIVDIDDESWRLIPYPWPYPREDIWARAIRNLADAGTKVIAFDIEFDSPDSKSDYLEQLNRAGGSIEFMHGDDALANAIRYAQSKGTRVVLAAKLVHEPTRLPPEYIQYPVKRIMDADPEPALINEVKDFDGTTRKYALYYEMGHEPGKWYLSLGMKALKEYWGLPDSVLPTINSPANEINYGPSRIRTYGKRASFMVNFYGPPSGAALPGQEAWKTFDRYPLSNILDDSDFDLRNMEEDSDWMDFFKLDSPLYGFVGESPFLNKIVLIGVSVNVLLDVKTTPYYNYAGMQIMMPGVEYHANAVQTILDENYVRVSGSTIELSDEGFWDHFLVVVLLAIITSLMIQFINPVTGGLLIFIEIMIFTDISLGFFTLDNFWLPKLLGANILPRALIEAYPTLFTIGVPGMDESIFVPIIQGIAAIVMTYGSIVVYRFIIEQKDKHYLKDTFGAYISPELIEQMYTEKQAPELGGESGILSAYFTDIASFSSFSEVLTASRLVELLNEYLTAMTDVLLEYNGTLDKYEGDAIVAFFGAPIHFDDHAKRALEVSLRMQEVLGDLRDKWASEGDKWPDMVQLMRMRIGINSGEIVTGNMGSRTRMNYTMMGDVVNTAARLEASAKQYGIYIQTTMPTLELAGIENFEWRFIDKVKVMGKSEAVEAVEILSLPGQLTEDMKSLKAVYDQAMDLYRAQKWDAAGKKFTASEKLEEVFPKRPTTPSKVYIDRCLYFKENPPGEDWDGSWTLTSK